MDKPNLFADAITASFISPNECDRNFEAANVVDGLFAIARALNKISDQLEQKSVLDPKVISKYLQDYTGPDSV